MGLNTAGFMPVLLSQDVSKEFLIQSYFEFNFFGFPVSINTSQVTTVIVMGFILILAFIACKWPIAIVCAVITIVYYLSCRKHSSKIVELMESKKPTRAKKCGE